MYSERFDNAQVAYSKWLKTSKQFADLIKMIEVRNSSPGSSQLLTCNTGNGSGDEAVCKNHSMIVCSFVCTYVCVCARACTDTYTFTFFFLQSGPLCKGLPISSYMLCPIQRIPRYKLLLEGIIIKLHTTCQMAMQFFPLCRLPQTSSKGSSRRDQH